ncbi:MAG: RagB/SusD family nutrient uptake outer membrane protein [Candidatus Cryptobacteroides sp.]
MKAKYILIAASCLLCLASCEKMLDIPQKGVLNYDTFYQTDEEAENALMACYLQLRGLEYNYVLGKNMLTDDFWAGGADRGDNAELEQLNEFTFGTDQSMLQGMFTSYYEIIYTANVVLGHVSDDSPIKSRARAEAKVFRAWSYFELISMWGNPPLVDHELDPSEYSCPNGSTEALWAFVENDLKEAIESGCLTQKSSQDEKSWRITKQFAQAMLGKAYLWQGKYKEAAAEFDNVVESKLYRLWENYEDLLTVRGKQNPESIFESIRVDDSNNAFDNVFTLTAVMIHYRTDRMTLNAADGLADTGWGFLNPTLDLYNDFVAVEGADGYRLKASLKTVDQMAERGHVLNVGSTCINEGVFMWKWRVLAEQYTQYGGGFPSFFFNVNNPRWMRYAEVLLCGAEAHLMAGNQTKADEYMNLIRNRAQAPQKSGYTLEEIKREKRIELCGESLRFQDLVRWGDAAGRLADNGEKSPVLGSNRQVSYIRYNGEDPSRYGFKDKHNKLPYPGVEIRLNKKIQQNPGW